MVPHRASCVSLRFLCMLTVLSVFHECMSNLHRGGCTRGGKFQNPLKDYALKGHVIANHSVSSRLDCTFECLSNPQCVSINYKEEGNPLHVCELNSNNRKYAASSLMSRPGYTYYDSNDNGVNCGVAFGAQRSDCRESCETPGAATNHWSDCPTYKTGRNCELWTDEAPHFEVKFPRRSALDYGLVGASHGKITHFTLSLWMKPSYIGPYTLINYDVTLKTKEIAVQCKKGECVLTIRGKIRNFHLGEIVTTNIWHHLCITWSNVGGVWNVFVDGALRKYGTNFQAGLLLYGQGKFVIGKSQTVLGKEFNEKTGFRGILSQVNLWSEVKSEDFVKKLAKQCFQGSTGDIIGWREFRHNLHGKVQKVEPESCKSPVPSSAFYFNFPSQSSANFIKGPKLPQMSQFSLCLWLRTTHPSVTILTYDVNNQSKVKIFTGNEGKFNLQLMSCQKRYAITPFYGNHWIHLCFTWENTKGEHNTFVDGVLRYTAQSCQIGGTVPGNGALWLGGLQSNEGVINIATLPFVGHLSHVNLWSRVLTPTSIEAMARGLGTDSGDMMSWQSLRSKARGNVQTIANAAYDLSSRNADYELDFGSARSTANYAIYRNVPSIKSFTGCTWFRSGTPDDLLALWSYSISNNPDELQFFVDKNIQSGNHQIYFRVKNNYRTIEFGDVNVRDKSWHFVCVVWTGHNGLWNIFLNGMKKGSGTNYQTGHVITGGGKFIIGQEQDSYGGGFDSSQTMVGAISRVNLWSRTIAVSIIEKIAKGADFVEGDIVPWHVFKNGIVGTLYVRSPSECTLPGPTLQSLRDGYCSSKFKNCSKTAKALFDKRNSQVGFRLRCYSMTSLKSVNHNTGYSYDEGKGSGCVKTMPGEIMKIRD